MNKQQKPPRREESGLRAVLGGVRDGAMEGLGDAARHAVALAIALGHIVAGVWLVKAIAPDAGAPALALTAILSVSIAIVELGLFRYKTGIEILPVELSSREGRLAVAGLVLANLLAAGIWFLDRGGFSGGDADTAAGGTDDIREMQRRATRRPAAAAASAGAADEGREGQRRDDLQAGVEAMRAIQAAREARGEASSGRATREDVRAMAEAARRRRQGSPSSAPATRPVPP